MLQMLFLETHQCNLQNDLLLFIHIKAIEQTTNTGPLFIALPKGMQGKHMLHEMCTHILFLSSSSPLDGFLKPYILFLSIVESPAELVTRDIRFQGIGPIFRTVFLWRSPCDALT
jgi:hypothetical protein